MIALSRLRGCARVCGWLAVLSAGACLAAGPAGAAPSSKPFEIVPGSFHVTPSTDQAGAHEDLTTSFDFAHSEATKKVFNDVRTIVVNLPAGFSGNNTAVPTCTPAQLIQVNNEAVEQAVARKELGGGNLPACPVASQVGQVSLECTGCANVPTPQRITVPLYNMEVTSFGVTVELGFKAFAVTQTLLVSVRPGDSGVTVTTPDIANFVEVRNIAVTVWGEPADHIHDAQRGELCGGETFEQFFETPGEPCHEEWGAPKAAGITPRPFLANPTSCEPHVASIEAYSWEEPAKPSTASAEAGPITGCESVPFTPSIEAQPSTVSAESPSGLDVSLLVPQTWENPFSIATSHLKGTTVTLPQGMTANPSLASGLGACTEAQFASETSSSPVGAGCPPESKIGSIEIETPVLAEKIDGAVYLAKPYENPFGSLLALYIVAKAPLRGIIVKVAGKIEPNPVTGQLTTTFASTPAFEGIPASAGTPQQPFSRFTLRFRPGGTAPLASPPSCGSYAVQAQLTPWSAPLQPRLVASQPFTITQGVHEGPCPSGGVPPFHPQAIAGAQNNAAGSYSPFYLRLIREDGEQELTRFSTIMPPGLTGNLTGIPFCPDTAIEAARAASRTGTQELAEPSCPAASQIGHTTVGAGVGPVLAQNPGRLYLAGPYHGVPLSLVSITSAVVGPFDLGTVVLRFALRINPITAQVEVDATGSDAIPHIIRGIVTHVRDIRAYVDRPNFIKNPTSCEHMQITNTITGAGADFTNPADQVPVTVATPFQAADCQNLAFKPIFEVTTSGKTSRANGASLSVKLTVPGALGTQANIRSVKVDLPKQLPSRLTTLQKACTAAQFNSNPAGCPAASVVGHARAITPILPVPLEGPAYFVSHGGEAFPSLIVVLQGYGVTIDLVGTTFISKKGITSSTFKTVPDQPVTSFELTLPEGKYSALAANGNLCAVTKTVTVSKRVTRRIHGHTRRVTVKVKQSVAAPLAMPTEFVAQNGATIHQSTPITVTGCAKHKARKASRHHKHNKKKR